jgi:hypothetical protein
MLESFLFIVQTNCRSANQSEKCWLREDFRSIRCAAQPLSNPDQQSEIFGEAAGPTRATPSVVKARQISGRRSANRETEADCSSSSRRSLNTAISDCSCSHRMCVCVCACVCWTDCVCLCSSGPFICVCSMRDVCCGNCCCWCCCFEDRTANCIPSPAAAAVTAQAIDDRTVGGRIKSVRVAGPPARSTIGSARFSSYAAVAAVPTVVCVSVCGFYRTSGTAFGRLRHARLIASRTRTCMHRRL